MKQKRKGKKDPITGRPRVDETPTFNLRLWPNNVGKAIDKYKVIKQDKRPHVLLWPGRIEYDPSMQKVEDLIRKLKDPVLVVARQHIGTGTIMANRLGIDMLVVNTRPDNDPDRTHLSPSAFADQTQFYRNLLHRSTHLYGVRGTKGLVRLKAYIKKYGFDHKVKTFDPEHPGGVAVDV